MRMRSTEYSQLTIALTLLLAFFTAVANVHAQENEDAKLQRHQKLNDKIPKLFELLAAAQLDEAQNLLNEMDKLTADDMISTMIVQSLRMSAISSLIEKDQVITAIKQHKISVNTLRKYVDEDNARNILTNYCTVLPNFLNVKDGKGLGTEESKEYKKLAADEFALVGDCVSEFRKYAPEGDVNLDTKHIATLLGTRHEIAEFLGDEEKAVAKTEISNELKSLRNFHSEKPNHEGGIFALEAILDSAASGFAYGSDEADELFKEKEKMFATALKNPKASQEIAKAFGRVLRTKVSRIDWSKPNQEKEIDAVIANTEALNTRYAGVFDKEIEAMQRTRAAYLKSRRRVRE